MQGCHASLAEDRHTSCRVGGPGIQADEIWSFVNAKARNVPEAHRDDPEWGDVWTWTTIDRETKLVPSWYVGDRSSASAIVLMDDLRSRLAGRVQLTTDGHKAAPWIDQLLGKASPTRRRTTTNVAIE